MMQQAEKLCDLRSQAVEVPTGTQVMEFEEGCAEFGHEVDRLTNNDCSIIKTGSIDLPRSQWLSSFEHGEVQSFTAHQGEGTRGQERAVFIAFIAGRAQQEIVVDVLEFRLPCLLCWVPRESMGH